MILWPSVNGKLVHSTVSGHGDPKWPKQNLSKIRFKTQKIKIPKQQIWSWHKHAC